MRYTSRPPRRRWPRRLIACVAVLVIALVGATMVVRHAYFESLKPLSSTNQTTQLVTIEKGSTVDGIATQLKKAGLIRSAWAFKLYVSSKNVRDALEAGTYSLDPGQSVPQIVSQLTHGKVATDLVTILPGQRLDQIRATLLNYGFRQTDVDAALDPASHAGAAALVDKPASGSLEGYLYPDSYQKTSATTPKQIVDEALAEMDAQLTPDIRAAFAQQGLSTYQGIILASIVEQEVNTQSDRQQAAQVFIKRLHLGMALGSDVTAYYGSLVAGKGKTLSYDSPYNTLIHTGLPPTPISNVNASALQAVAHPAATDWLYFVTGDDGVTHFSQTLEEHEAATAQYCHKLCSQ
ncbi:MAG TPA: endolytic transglycosylase MltG [Candidatus Saccharimonadales bacterium]|nr:endolytic transglycosylase MltG [Candidatus Saccharimonadales bacterium]